MALGGNTSTVAHSAQIRLATGDSTRGDAGMLADDGQLLRSYDRLVVKATMARSPATTTAAQLTAMGICREPMLTGQP